MDSMDKTIRLTTIPRNTTSIFLVLVFIFIGLKKIELWLILFCLQFSKDFARFLLVCLPINPLPARTMIGKPKQFLILNGY